MLMKTRFLTIVVAGALISAAAAQTTEDNKPQGGAVSSSGSANSQTNVDASKKGANANTSTSGSQQTGVSTGSSQASAQGNESAQGNASASVPEGTQIPAVLSKGLDSKKNKEGDEVVAKTTQDVLANGQVLIPRNSKIIGHVTQAKSRAKGETDSALGIVFDRAELKNGQQLNINAAIQSIAGPVQTAADVAGSAGNDDDMGSGPIGGGSTAPAPARSSAGGGVLGTAGSTVGAVGGTVGSTAGSAAGIVNNDAGAAVGGVGRTAGGATAGAHGALGAGSTGVIGLKDLQLNNAASGSAAGSVITSSGKNVHLDSGSQMVLRTSASRGSD